MGIEKTKTWRLSDQSAHNLIGVTDVVVAATSTGARVRFGRGPVIALSAVVVGSAVLSRVRVYGMGLCVTV